MQVTLRQCSPQEGAPWALEASASGFRWMAQGFTSREAAEAARATFTRDAPKYRPSWT